MNDKKINEIPQLWTAISHGIRTPLNVITGMTEISEQEVYDVELVKDCLVKIKESSQTMQKVVDSLVDYSAIMQENVELSKEKVNVNGMLTEIVMQSYVLAKKNSCHFNMFIQDLTEEEFIGDEEHVNQIILAMVNLISRFTGKDGNIDFSVQQIGITNTTVYIRFGLKSSKLQLPQKVKEYLLQPSAKMNMELLSPIGDFELFEMNAIHIFQLMGGKLSVGDESELFFDMEFGKIQQTYSENGIQIFKKQKVLIVAESPSLCDESGRMLTDMGMNYDSAFNEKDALNKISKAENENSPYTICIIDRVKNYHKFTNLTQDIRNSFGQDMIIIVTVNNPKEHHNEDQNFGANYVIDRSIFRSTLFDTMVSIEKGIQLSNDLKETYDFRGSRVLVAEDTELNMEIITKLLSNVKIQVTCVENGLEALNEFERKPDGYFGAVLLDINMPVMDGYEAARNIRKSGKTDAAQIPIYAMSANAFKEDIDKSLASGMNGHISKPIDVKVLYSILKHALKQQAGNEISMLRDLVEIDPLTGCLNRRGFETHVSELIRSHIPVAYLAIDVDDFKLVNDNFGHSVGDEVLKKLTKIMKKKFHETDYFVRLGGDEFAIVLVDFKNRPSVLMRRIDEVNEELFNPKDGLPPVTISVGAVISEEGYKETLYNEADKALYKSKHIGKGMCTIFDYEQQDATEDTHELEECLYTESLYYPNKNVKVIVNDSNKFQSRLMVKNKPVCFVSGFYEKIFPVYSFNGFFPEQLGYSINEFCKITQRGFLPLVHKYDAEHFLENKGKNRIYNQRVRLECKNGDYIWFNMEYALLKTTNQRPFWMASLKNIDDQVVDNLCGENYCVASVLDCEKETVVIKKGAHLVHGTKLNIQKSYNYTELISKVITETIKENNREQYLEKASLSNVMHRLSTVDMYEFIVYQKLENEEYRAVRHKFKYTEGNTRYILSTWELMGQYAEIDELTDSLNETGFYKLTEETLKKGDADAKYAILFFDISGFKAWNSMLGRSKADMLLKSVSRSIEKSELKPLTVGRLMADHFVCLVEHKNIHPNVISQLCNYQHEISNNMVHVQMKCGIFTIDNRKESVRNMCDKAKLAITQISNEYAVPYHYFDDTLNKKYVQHRRVLNNVEYALERKEFEVYYQPIVDAKTKKVASAEALIRWITPDGEMLSPAIFLPALEEGGNIADVDAYVQNTVSEMMERRILNNHYVVPVSVNVSRMDFLNAGFVDNLKKLVSSVSVEKNLMRMEVTESAFIEIGKSGEKLIKELRDFGIKILMDDFGTGVSTLAGITSQQFDIVKIDRAFINDLNKNNGSEAVIQNVISMCHALDLKIVAEGIETEEQYQFLKDVDCDYIQGYYFYKPLPQNEFEELLDNQM